jgi:hypothetical protein
MSKPTIEKPYPVEGKPECPRCHEVIVEAQDVSPGASQQFKKGKLLVCGHCALVCVIGDSKLLPVSKRQIKSLPKETQKMLWVTCNMVAARIAENN